MSTNLGTLLTKWPLRSIYNVLHGKIDNFVVDLVAAVDPPADGTTGEAAGYVGPGSTWINNVSGRIFQNRGTKASPAWRVIGGDMTDLSIPVINKSGGTLAVGSLIYLSGWDATSGKFSITLADADAGSGVRRAHWILRAAILNNAAGLAYKTHLLGALNTNAGNVGDPVYLDTTAGGWTLTGPTGDAIQQVVGRITVKDVAVGFIQFALDHAVTKIGTTDLQSNSVGTGQLDTSVIQKATPVVLTSAQIKAIRATPIQILPALGAGKIYEIISASAQFLYGGTNAFTNPQNLSLKFKDGTTVALANVTAAGFLDQTASQQQEMAFPAGAINTKANSDNQIVCIHNTGASEITGNAANDNTIRIDVIYRVLTPGW